MIEPTLFDLTETSKAKQPFADSSLDFYSQPNMPSSPDAVYFDHVGLDEAQDFPLSFSFDFASLKDFDSSRAFEPTRVFEDRYPSVDMVPLQLPENEFPVEVTKEKRTKKRKSSSSSMESDADESQKKVKSSSPQRSRNPTSSYRGVSRCTKDGRWQARIRVCKEVVYLGRFQTEEQAARRYDEAARLHHGKSAMLNFVTDDDVASGCKSVFSSERSASPETV